MAQAGFTPISLYFSTTAAAVPTSGNLVAGELALNTVDEKLYFKNSAGTVKLLASNATSAPVLSFQTSLSGLTPSTATSGVVTLAGTLGVASGGTGLTAGTSGGILGYTATGTLASSVALTANALVLGAGAGATPTPMASLGTTTTVLHGNASGAPTFGAVSLTADVTGTLPVANGGTNLTSFTSGGVVYASSTSALATGSAITFDGTNLILGSASPNFQGSSSIGSVTLINNSGGAHVRAYGGSHATRADFTEFVNGATTSFINSSGNFGLAVTPSTWSVGKSFEIASVGNSVFGVGAADMRITAGAYYNAAWKYAVTGSAITKYEQTSGVHTWWNAPSGTTGNNATFTQAMTLDASGNLLIGSTANANSAKLKSKVSGGSVGFEVTDEASSDFVVVPASSAGVCKIGPTAGAMSFQTAGTERARIDSSGNLGIGTSSPAFKTEIVGGADTVETTLLQIRSNFGGIGTGSTIVFRNSTNSTGDSGGVQLAALRDTTSGGSLVIRTADSSGTIQNRVKITETGLVAIGTTTAVSGNTNARLVVKSSGGSDACEIQATTNGILAFDFRNSSGTQAGSITINSSSVAYNTSSDYRLKNTIAPMTGALAKVAQLKPVTYKWNADGSDGEGFIAHELAEVCPYAVTGAKDAVDANGNIKPQGIDVSFLVATLTAALQEQQAIIESLKARLDAANL